MYRFWLPVVALLAISAKAQNVNYPDIPHIHTALNHLTVIDVGEPIQWIAAADLDAFQIERENDKVLLEPLKEGASTNLILWTASRQISYELDAPGDLAKMNVLVRNLPQPIHVAVDAPTAKERQQIATAATTQAILDAKEIVPERLTKTPFSGVTASIVRVLHTSGGTYLQYVIVNRSSAPFRVTTPSVAHLQPTQASVSLLALRDRQLSAQTLSSLKSKSDGAANVVSAESQQVDVAPGGTTSGYVLVHTPSTAAPQIYQLSFGTAASGPLVEAVVI